MKARGKLVGWLLLGLLGGVLGQGCGANSSRRDQPGRPAAGSGGRDAGVMTVEPPGGEAGQGVAPRYSELCGIADSSSCVPDEPLNAVCRPSIGGAGSQLPSGGRGVGGGSGEAPANGGESGAGVVGTAGETGASGGGGAPGAQGGEASQPGGAAGSPTDNTGAGAGGETGQGLAPGLSGGASSGGRGSGVSGESGTTAGATGNTVSPTSCQVALDPASPTRPRASCLPAGSGKDSEACFSGGDCQPGFACVGTGPGQCRKYCCAGADACTEGKHCSIEGLVSLETSGPKLDVPVCMPAVDCSLAEPYPCSGGACSCPADSACVVVGNDGTTSCVPASNLPSEGKGDAGKPCPCAWGFVCSQATKECVTLCQVAAPAAACGGARCQPSAALPDGFGTCVGVAPQGTE